MKKSALFLLPLAFLFSCVNPFFESLLKDEPEKIEIEASLSWRNDWIAEGQGLARDTDNEFASVPGNPLKAVPTIFYQDSFETTEHTGAVAVYPAQRWQSETGGTHAAFVIYYKIPGVASYGGTNGNLYLRVSRNGGAWGDWDWAVNPAATEWYEIKDGILFFKTGFYFAEDNSGWTKREEPLVVEIVLFEGSQVTATDNQERNEILSVRKRLKQRIFTVDLSDVTFDPGNTPPP
jgi:hypothetical protein